MGFEVKEPEWVAGLMDAGGTISIRREKRDKRNPSIRHRPNIRIPLVGEFNTREAEDIIKQIFPYLEVKKEQAQCILDLQATKIKFPTNKKLGLEKKRDEIANKLKSLKKWDYGRYNLSKERVHHKDRKSVEYLRGVFDYCGVLGDKHISVGSYHPYLVNCFMEAFGYGETKARRVNRKLYFQWTVDDPKQVAAIRSTLKID